MNYVVGFYFSIEDDGVLLIRKNRPAWQRGRLNGVGGKIEEGETAYDAMVREFQEETGIFEPKWESYCQIVGNWGSIEIFKSYGEPQLAKNVTDEKLEVHNWDILPSDVLPNLTWLVPMARLDLKNKYLVREFNG
jgi:8-oxo-dGTP diphosphatase